MNQYWLVVWNHGIFMDLPIILGRDFPQLTIRQSYFSEGLVAQNHQILVHRFHIPGPGFCLGAQDSPTDSRSSRSSRFANHQFVRKMITELMGWKNWDVFSGISPCANLTSFDVEKPYGFDPADNDLKISGGVPHLFVSHRIHVWHIC